MKRILIFNLEVIIRRCNMGLKTTEVSNMLGVSARTIQRWVKSGKLKPETSINNAYTFTHDEVRKFIRENKLKVVDETKNFHNHSLDRIDYIEQKLDLLNLRINSKADDIVFIQLINQRTEIEELKQSHDKLLEEIKCLHNIIDDLFAKSNQTNRIKSDQFAKKGIFQNFFT
jgi:chromosome-anchoring protein RacA